MENRVPKRKAELRHPLRPDLQGPAISSGGTHGASPHHSSLLRSRPGAEQRPAEGHSGVQDKDRVHSSGSSEQAGANTKPGTANELIESTLNNAGAVSSAIGQNAAPFLCINQIRENSRRVLSYFFFNYSAPPTLSIFPPCQRERFGVSYYRNYFPKAAALL